MKEEEILEVIEQFVAGAKYAADAGFKGVQIQAAHGYLLSQFLSPQTNHRSGTFGGSAAKRAEIVLRIIRETRAVTPKGFCVGIKLNSADSQTHDNIEEVMEQIGLIVDAGVDFLEISGGTYENPTMGQSERTEVIRKPSTAAREAFFLDFAKATRARFPEVPLMVTGGFRTRTGMTEALESGDCDIVGIARPAAMLPKLPKEVVFNEKVSDAKAKIPLAAVDMGSFAAWMFRVLLNVGPDTIYAQKQFARIADGQKPEYSWRG